MNWFWQKKPAPAQLATEYEGGYTMVDAFDGRVHLTQHCRVDGMPVIRISFQPATARIIGAALIGNADEIDAA